MTLIDQLTFFSTEPVLCNYQYFKIALTMAGNTSTNDALSQTKQLDHLVQGMLGSVTSI
jgi:hypothetical protein